MTNFYLKGKRYRIKQIEKITTPRLVVFKDKVEENIRRMKNYLNKITNGKGLDHLCMHVKTNKSSYLTKILLKQGIFCFKSTLNEVEMLVNSGVKDIFIAYPLLEKEAVSIVQIIQENPEVKFQVQIGCREHADILKKIGVEYGIQWNLFIDVDVGMHRTGIKPEKVLELYEEIADQPEFKFTGLHGYDGHIHYKDESRRASETEKAMEKLVEIFNVFSYNQVEVERIVAAGSLTFEQDLKILYKKIADKTQVMVSPGTWIYWDTGYDSLLPEKFEIAALVLAQVIEVSDENRITLNCGHKRWGADRGPVEVFSGEGMKVSSFNEEHTVLEHKKGDTYRVGDYVFIAPKHICSTVNLYEYFTLIGKDEEIKELQLPVDARNR